MLTFPDLMRLLELINYEVRIAAPRNWTEARADSSVD